MCYTISIITIPFHYEKRKIIFTCSRNRFVCGVAIYSELALEADNYGSAR